MSGTTRKVFVQKFLFKNQSKDKVKDEYENHNYFAPS